MRGLHRFLLLLLLVLGPDLLARVLSYAPYTTRPAKPSYHLRTGRWFALVESLSGGFNEYPWEELEVVLYDAHGAEEPRVVYTSRDHWAFALVAVHETPAGQFDAQSGIDLLIARNDRFGWRYLFSSDAGASWRPLDALNGAPPHGITYETNAFRPDYGGPQARGLDSPVSIGGAFPFVVSTSRGTYGISALGHVTRLHRSGRLIGRDAAGSRFLILANDGLSIVDSRGHTTNVGTAPSHQRATGWITSAGDAYVQYDRTETRDLLFYDPPRGSYVVASGPPSTRFFAVPTHDYNGAWIIQRMPGQWTALSRHTRVPGIETFWRDPSAPEVEALHAAASGEKLLIQVHRPRVQTAASFLDPALAVWRVGDPAPAEYDELFLSEGPWKGFVHLDVDTIESGAPFVFDAASFTEISLGTPIASPAGPGGADVMQEWGVVRGSLKQRLVLPAVARQAGAFGSFWLTDVVLHNPLDVEQRVDFRLVPIETGPRIASAQPATLTLAPREIRVVADVLKTLFHLEQGGGSIVVEPESAIAATTRTYTRSRGGTVGFGGVAIDFYNAASPRFPVHFGGAFPGPEYRTNLVVTDTSGRGTEVELGLHGGWGEATYPTRTFHAPAGGVMQTNELSAAIGVPLTGLSVRPVSGGGIVTVVAIDNRTNDATWFPPDLPAAEVRTIPMARHIDLPDGRQIRTDIYLINTGRRSAELRIEGRSWDAVSAVRTTFFYVYEGEARRIHDIVGFLKMTGTVRLRFESRDGVRLTSRTYIVDKDGGTYGSLIPPLNSFQSVTTGEALEILGIVGAPTLRAGLSFVDLSNRRPGERVKATVSIVDEHNHLLDRFDVEWPSAGGTQIEDLFGDRGVAVPHAALVRVEAHNGLIGAFATLTDTVTGDLTYLAAGLAAKPK